MKAYSHFDHTAEKRIFCLKSQNEIHNIYDFTELFLKNYYSEDLKDLAQAIKYLDKSENFDTTIQRLSKDAVADLDELNQIALLLENYMEFFTVLNSLNLINETKDEFHKLKRVYFSNFLKEFRSFVSKEGETDYLKHPLLRKLYREIVELEDGIRKKLSHLKTSDFASSLQYEGHDVINDRYVLPVRTDSYKSSHGQIISRSDSGQTLFIEPKSLKDTNYKRLELIINLKREISNLTRKFSKILKEHTEHLNNLTRAHLMFDHIYALARYSHEFNLVRPTLSDELEISLKNAFHPLIEKPVKNDIEIKNKNNGLIISGPNTGGKTATLKTIILSILYAKNGLFIPADSGTIHLYENLFYFGNDGQNLPDGLSSFAAEVQNYTDLFESLGDSNLIVIDEIFNSTSSEEASALAISLFTELNKIGKSHLLVSTHHQMLKTYIHQDQSYISAHVGFDIEANRPTYKLIYGLPGSSQALKIFSLLTEKNDINRSIYNNALKVLDKKMVSYEALLENVSKKEQQLDKTLKENKQLNHELKNQKKAMEGVFQLKLDEKIQQAERKIKNLFDKAQDSLSRAKKNEISKKGIVKEEASLKAQLHEISPIQKKQAEEVDKYQHLKIPQKFVEGEAYFSTFLGQTITLKSFNHKKNQAMVSKGIVTIKCPLDSLRLPGHSKQIGKNKVQVNVSVESSRSGKIEYDCRGMRLDEFKSIVEVAISDLLSNKVPFINIIHGHGTGVLKSWIRKHVKNHSDITLDTNESGNDGETKIILSL